MDLRLVSIIIILFVNFTSMLVLNEHFSLDALYKNISIPTIGAVLSTYPFGNIFASLYLGKKISTLGRRYLLRMCSYVLSLSFFFLHLSLYIFNRPLFVLVASIARTLQGIAVGGVCTIAYSYIDVFFSDR